jgi:acyl carrier protein
MLTENDYADLKEGLRRCSPETVAAAIRYRERGDLDAVPEVVFGILARYQPATAPVKLADATDDMRLIEDIGLDSLTLLEIVMSIEEVLKVRIENEELRELSTLGRLNEFLRAKINGTGKPSATKRYTREQILLILPQQPPFLFLDSAELSEAGAQGRYLVKGDEFFLEGHFKNNPIFPASIVFEALGQAACLWTLEKAPAKTGRKIPTGEVFFASLDGAKFSRKTRPGDMLQFELKLLKLRNPLAVFEGIVTCEGERVARIERLVLAFGGALPEEKAEAAPAAVTRPERAALPALSSNGHH